MFPVLIQASHDIEDIQGRTPLHWAAASPAVDNTKVKWELFDLQNIWQEFCLWAGICLGPSII